MYCRNCGNQIADGSQYCASCGSRVESVDYEKRVPISEEVICDPRRAEKEAAQRNILTLGICSVAFAITMFLGFIGIIFASVCKKRIRDYESRFGATTGMAKVGKGLSTGGLFGGIAMTVFSVLYVILIAICVFIELKYGYEFYY